MRDDLHDLPDLDSPDRLAALDALEDVLLYAIRAIHNTKFRDGTASKSQRLRRAYVNIDNIKYLLENKETMNGADTKLIVSAFRDLFMQSIHVDSLLATRARFSAKRAFEAKSDKAKPVKDAVLDVASAWTPTGPWIGRKLTPNAMANAIFDEVEKRVKARAPTRTMITANRIARLLREAGYPTPSQKDRARSAD